MTFNIRQIVIFFFLLMSFIPFLLMTDLFPFMRFAMFAETVRAIPQKEFFTVEVLNARGGSQSLSERQIGLDDSHLNYLARRYYYNGQLDFFSTELKKSGLLKDNEKITVTQKIIVNGEWQKHVLLIK
ncbi:MAG: hypothetical protein JWO58_1412 [Chitinophagaceae bacterium]|nr:hypothetical protein [Chitinophagaceae bacterium]